MIIPDVNLLLYATVTGFPLHVPAREWWEEALSGSTPVGLAPPAVFGFVRVVTNRRVLEEPMAIAVAAGHVRDWLGVPLVQMLVPGGGHLELALGLLEAVGTAANLTTDAQLAAFAVEQDGAVYSNDSDFARFADIRWVNPLSVR